MISFLFTLACTTEIESQEPSSPPLSPPELAVENTEIDIHPVPNPYETVEEPSVSIPVRDLRRMNLDQLQHAIEELTGHGYEGFDNASGALGKPDYIQIVKEIREPELFFQKYLQDAAHKTCDSLLDDEEEAAQENRRFLKYIEIGEEEPAAVKENLSFLLLRFHGHRYPLEHPQVELWYSLFEGIQESTEDTQTTWKAMCVALIRHPDFYSY